jgi:hypothetical protein
LPREHEVNGKNLSVVAAVLSLFGIVERTLVDTHPSLHMFLDIEVRF